MRNFTSRMDPMGTYYLSLRWPSFRPPSLRAIPGLQDEAALARLASVELVAQLKCPEGRRGQVKQRNVNRKACSFIPPKVYSYI